MLHLLDEDGANRLGLSSRALDDELVVHLQQELRLQSFGAHARVHADHGSFDNVRRRALNGHIERHALAEAAEVEVG